MMVYMAQFYWLFCNYYWIILSIITDATKTNLIKTNVSFLHLKKHLFYQPR